MHLKEGELAQNVMLSPCSARGKGILLLTPAWAAVQLCIGCWAPLTLLKRWASVTDLGLTMAKGEGWLGSSICGVSPAQQAGHSLSHSSAPQSLGGTGRGSPAVKIRS